MYVCVCSFFFFAPITVFDGIRTHVISNRIDKSGLSGIRGVLNFRQLYANTQVVRAIRAPEKHRKITISKLVTGFSRALDERGGFFFFFFFRTITYRPVDFSRFRRTNA